MIGPAARRRGLRMTIFTAGATFLRLHRVQTIPARRRFLARCGAAGLCPYADGAETDFSRRRKQSAPPSTVMAPRYANPETKFPVILLR